jgi:hypothetical protein
MQKEVIDFLDKNFKVYRQKKLSGRYITFSQIEPLLLNLTKKFKGIVLGESFNNLPIYKITIGNGKKKILFWSQMHGNESTGTKALFDLFHFFENPLNLSDLRNTILKECTLVFIPMLNPDGAKLYTRLNAQNIDLNRDAVALKAPESKLLQKALQDFKPDYCFNLHDQRTIFSVGAKNCPATISLLAPSEDQERTITEGRKKTMQVVIAINNVLQELIPNQMGRYTDEFYPTATGDNFQKAGFNTVLIEAGHFKDDYRREITRKYNFIALVTGINQIISDSEFNYKDYFKIPENKKDYFDAIYTNVKIKNKKYCFGMTYKEELKNNKIHFIPKIKKIGMLDTYNADKFIEKEIEHFSIKEFENALSNQII